MISDLNNQIFLGILFKALARSEALREVKVFLTSGFEGP
jgi:hypothetical protein